MLTSIDKVLERNKWLTFRSMKHDAIVEQGIPILERVPIPDEMIPEDSRVEIDAKIHAGYCEHIVDAFLTRNGSLLKQSQLARS